MWRSTTGVVGWLLSVENRSMEFSLPKRWKHHAVVVVLAAVSVVVTGAATRMTYRRFQLGQTFTEVEQEIAMLEEERTQLTDTLASFDEFATIEQAAREVLNLQREGEQVVILLPTGEPVTTSEAVNEEVVEEEVEPSNLVKWWGYFFGTEG